jgi:selenocysteine-specific elongation factor
MNVILGTAGHIDHGKTALIKALTGIDTDRLKEERERGISIDLGFAHFDAGDAATGVVDVPGHERFIRNMLAGAHGIDVVRSSWPPTTASCRRPRNTSISCICSAPGAAWSP